MDFYVKRYFVTGSVTKMGRTTEWLCYDFEKPRKLFTSSVYWYDDGPWGGCRVPKAWKLYYKDESCNWQPVNNKSPYFTRKGDTNKVYFEPIVTTSVKLEVTLPEDNSAGIFEWSVE